MRTKIGTFKITPPKRNDNCKTLRRSLPPAVITETAGTIRLDTGIFSVRYRRHAPLRSYKQMTEAEKYMRIALREAERAAEEGEIPIGAVVVCRDRVVAKAHNQTERLNDVTAHAEMLALTAAASAVGGKYLDKCTLYVTVEPCPMCAAALRWAQLGTLVYGASDPKRGYRVVSEKLLHPKTTVLDGALASECGQLVSDFFKELREK